MNDRTRRIVAFVAGRLISGKPSGAIVDVETSMVTQFDGDILPQRVDIAELEDGSRITGQGGGTEQAPAFLLTDHREGVEIRLSVRENRFFGWDLTSDTPFYGRVSDDSITLRHPDSPRRFHYII